jgi:hypothetical protein
VSGQFGGYLTFASGGGAPIRERTVSFATQIATEQVARSGTETNEEPSNTEKVPTNRTLGAVPG